MNILHIIIQLIIGLGILNVWFLRSSKNTSYRGGEASNLKEEFRTYGLPEWMFWLVGVLKVGAALALLAGIFLPALVVPAATLMAALMLAAIATHAKVKDAPVKSLPAVTLLILSLILIFTW